MQETAVNPRIRKIPWSRGLIRAWWEVSVVASYMVLDPLAPSDLDEDLKGKRANSLY